MAEFDPVTHDDDQTLAGVLRGLAQQGFTGVMRVNDDGEVWLAGGRIYLAVTSTSDDLASVVFGADVGTLADVQELLGRPGIDVTETLVESRPDSIPALGRLLHEHNLTGLFEMMVAGAGRFTTESLALHPLGSRFAESVDDLLGQAERRLGIWREIAGRIPSTGSRFAMADRLPDGVDERVVSADEWRYLALVATGASVGDLIAATGESAFRVMTSLYRLLLEGVVVDAD